MSKPEPTTTPRPSLIQAITSLLNSHSVDNASNTPDHILAQYLMDCLSAFEHATNARAKWYGHYAGAPVPSVNQASTHSSPVPGDFVDQLRNSVLRKWYYHGMAQPMTLTDEEASALGVLAYVDRNTADQYLLTMEGRRVARITCA